VFYVLLRRLTGNRPLKMHGGTTAPTLTGPEPAAETATEHKELA